MASWAGVLALSGFHYSGVEQRIEFASAEHSSQVFWSNGYAWGTCMRTPIPNGVEVDLTVLHGTLALRQLAITGVGATTFELPRALAAGEKLVVRVKA
jgi:non-lysosomal glucosylceramidase